MKYLLALLLLLTPMLARGQGAGSVAVVPTVADLTNRVPSQLNPVVQVQGYRTISDWGAGRTMRHNPTSTNAVDNGCTFATVTGEGRWEALDCENGRVNIRYFGAYGNGTSNDLPYIRAAGSKLQLMGGGIFEAPPGTYVVSGSIGPAVHLTNISNVSISADAAIFTESDYVDSTWTSVTLTNLGTVVYATWAAPHGFAPGSLFLVKDSSDVAFDGYWTVTHVDSPTKIRFNLTSYNVPAGPATALAHVSDTSHVLIRLDSCTNVNLGKIVFRGHVLPVDNQFRLGWRVVEAFRGTTGVRGEIDAEGAAYGFYSGEYGNQSISGCSDLRIKVVAKNVGYPVQATGLGDSAFDVICDTVHRGGYFGGVRRSSANIWAKNWDIVGALLSHQPDPSDSRGCEDFTLRVWDTGTTVPQKLLAYGGYRHMSSVAGYANTNAVKHKNLDIRVYGKNVPRGAGLIVQTYGTNHWVDGLKFGGNMDQSGLNSTNTGWPFFIYDTTPATAGHYKDLVIDDFTWKSTTNSGGYPGYIRLARAENNVEFNRYSTDIYTSQQLPDGIHTVTVPRFPDWSAGSFEAASMQKLSGGIKLSGTRTIAYLDADLGTNDFTVQWVGSIPGGDSGLFVATSSAIGTATNASFGASVLGNGNLVVRAYGSSASDYRGVYVTNWANTLRGDIVSLGIVKTAAGIDIYTDGHKSAAVEETSGTPPAWTDALAGVYVFIGNNTPESWFTGTIYRFGIWDWDRSSDFPDLAIGWQSGLVGRGYSTSFAMDPATANGSFETLGAGTPDVFGSWTETIAGTSTIAVSTNAVHGTNSMAMNVDGAGSFAAVTSGSIMDVGSSYTISLWARVSSGGASGQLALTGPASGEYPFAITDTWTQYFYNGVWGATSFSIKRWSLTSQSAEIDDIRIRKIGALIDYDWTTSPADQVNGKFSAVLGGAASRVVPRGPGMSDDRGNSDVNLEAGFDAPVQLFATALTGPRVATLLTNNCRRGDTFRIVRTGGGAGTLTAAGRTVADDQWLDVAFDGTAWVPIGYGYVTNTYVTPPTNILIAPLVLKVGTNTDPAIFILASNLPASSAYHGRYGADGIEAGVGTNARSAKILATDIPAGGWTVWSNITLKGDIIRSNGLALTGSLDSKATTNHTHDASNTVSGQFESARIGAGTSDTDTFLRGGEPPTWDQLSVDDIPNLPASRITSGNFDAARLGTGTATTNTFLQGNGTNAPFWGTVPSTPSPTNGIADAPADGIFYGRKNNAWTQPDIADLSGVSGFGLAWVDGTVVDSTDALDALDLIGAGVATIDSPATYAVRVGSGGTVSTRHRLNLIAAGGLTLSISDDSGNDESDVTVSIPDAGITYAKIEDVTASRLLGRGAGAGDGVVQELELGGGLTMTGTTIHTNPVVVTASKLIGRGSASGNGAAEEVTLGTGLTMTGTTLSASASTGGPAGWLKFTTTGSSPYGITSTNHGGCVSGITFNDGDNDEPMDVTVTFTDEPWSSASYLVQVEIESGYDPDTDAVFPVHWWVKKASKTTGSFVLRGSYPGTTAMAYGDTWTVWIWNRE